MEILINGQSLDLAPDFAIEMEELNPFFSEIGAQSLPAQLPFTPRNLDLLGHPERIAHTFKLDNEHDAVIRHGVFQKNGKLVIFSADKENGIDATFYMNDGEFYTEIQGVKLESIDFANDPDYNPDPFTGTVAEKAVQWMQRFEAVQRGEVQVPYAIFPVCTKMEKTTVESDDPRGSGTSTVYVYEFLNEPDKDSTTIPYRLIGYEERTIDDVVCPVGYGITPFLKFNYLLRMLFAHFGYSLQPSLFDTDPDLSKMLVLNNNADTICAGKLHYKQLVPTCEIAEFIDAIRNKFSCEFLLDSRTKTVTICFFNDLSVAPADMDVSPFVVDTPQITHDSFKQLKLSGGTGIESAQPATETMEQLMQENIYVSALNETEFAAQQTMMRDEVVLRKSTGQVYKQIASGGTVALTPIGSSYFNYDKKVKLEYDERDAGDEQPPVAIKSIAIPDNSGGRGATQKMIFPCIGNRRHLNTGIKKADEVTEEKVEECKIMFCFDIGRQDGYVYMGTPFCYNHNGISWGNLSLQYAGNEGLFVRFWKSYDALLRHAFRKVTCRLQMPVAEFLKFNIFTPKLLNGTPVMPISMKYSISQTGVEISEVEFRTLRLQQPYALNVEQEAPQFNASQYYWIRYDNIYEVASTYAEYPDTFTYRGKVTTTPPDARSYPPPTEEEFNAGGQKHIEYYKMNIIAKRKTSGTSNSEYVIATDVAYTTWLEPRKKN
jgi:hypothetical protein